MLKKGFMLLLFYKAWDATLPFLGCVSSVDDGESRHSEIFLKRQNVNTQIYSLSYSHASSAFLSLCWRLAHMITVAL